MLKQLRLGVGAIAALAALALGGATIAGATNSSPTKVPPPVALPEVTSHPDGDNIQSGNQNTPDAVPATKADLPAGDSADTPSETGTSETATASDGPGGHADEPGNPNADTQQQGQN